MYNHNFQKRYYESQSEPKWQQKKQDFEGKLEELRQLRTELYTQKQAIRSPKSINITYSKSIEELQILLALKDEEIDTLKSLLECEKDKSNDAALKYQVCKKAFDEIETKLNFLQSQNSEKDKVIGKFYNEMFKIRGNVQKLLESSDYKGRLNVEAECVGFGESEKAEIERLQSVVEMVNNLLKNKEKELESTQNLYRISVGDLDRLEKLYKETLEELEKLKKEQIVAYRELLSPKNKSWTSDKLSDYLNEPKDATSYDILLNETKTLKEEISRKDKEIFVMKEENEAVEEKYKVRIFELEKEILKYENVLADRNADHKYSNSRKMAKDKHGSDKFSYDGSFEWKKDELIEEYKCNARILNENNKLLQEKIKEYEKDKQKSLQGQRAESKFIAEEFSKSILANFNKTPEKNAQIQRNLASFLLQNEETLEVIITQALLLKIFGDDYKSLFTLKAKMESLLNENTALKHELSKVPQSLAKKINLKNISPKKPSNSLSHESFQKLLTGHHSVSKSFSSKKMPEDKSHSLFVVETGVSDISDYLKCSSCKVYKKNYENLITKADLVNFLQITTSALEESLI